MSHLAEKLFAFQIRLGEAKRNQVYNYHRPLEVGKGCWAKIDGQSSLLLSSYNYLGLQHDPRILKAIHSTWSTFGSGSHGSPVLAGTTHLHLKLQEELADFVSCDDVMLFSSGYVANLATISTICSPKDFVFSDKLNHASIVDGCALSGATVRRFRHGDILQLERMLADAPSECTKLVVIDAVFSMDGDIADLPKISALCQRYQALLMVDEAHSLGVLGNTGRGIEEHFNMSNSIDIKMGVLSKAIPCTGGYVGGKKLLIEYLRHHARGYVFSGSMIPTSVAAAHAALKILKTEPWRVSLLKNVSDALIRSLRQQGVDCGNSKTPIIPVMTYDEEATLSVVQDIQSDGVLLFGVLPPAVKAGTCRLRVCANAAMTEKEITFASQVISRHVNKATHSLPQFFENKLEYTV